MSAEVLNLLHTSDQLSCVEEEEEVWEGLMALRRFQAKIEEAETTRKVEIRTCFNALEETRELASGVHTFNNLVEEEMRDFSIEYVEDFESDISETD